MDGAKSLKLLTIQLIACIIGLLLILYACNQVRIGEAEIPGTYRADFYNGTEELILKTDGTFDETFTYRLPPLGDLGPPTGASYQNSGQWRYSLEWIESFVILDDAIVSPLSEPPNKFEWKLKAHRPYGRFEGVVLDWDDPDKVVHLNRIN